MRTTPLRPILVVLDYRGGDRFARALDSIAEAEDQFSRIVLSVTGPLDSPDLDIAAAYRERMARQGTPTKAELICSERELPTMQHQRFWIDYLTSTGARPDDWIYWLAYDDQVRVTGIRNIVAADGSWPLRTGTAYFGPWAMRHEQADVLYNGPWDDDLESWTSFPTEGPTELPVAEWIGNQLEQPTYMQMSGSVVPFESHRRLVHSHPAKAGPMRIEMATAASPETLTVAEFPEPVSIIYGRSNSDRASYGQAARKEDVHLAQWLARYGLRHPHALPSLTAAAAKVVASYTKVALRKAALPEEEWRVRGTVGP